MTPSTGLKNGVLSGDSLKSLLDGGEIRFYAGTVPANADAAIGGATLLCTIKNGGSGINFASAAAGGVLQKASGETWGGTNVASGTATFYRHVKSDDDGSASTTAVRLQGSLGLAGADINLTSVALVSGAPQTLNYYSVGLPG